MKENKLTPGQLRMQYLDIATRSLSNNEFEITQLNIDSFILWIKDDSPEDKDLREKFQIIEKEADKAIQEKYKALEQSNLQKIEINELMEKEASLQTVNNIKKKLNACVQISFKHGLFND